MVSEYHHRCNKESLHWSRLTLMNEVIYLFCDYSLENAPRSPFYNTWLTVAAFVYLMISVIKLLSSCLISDFSGEMDCNSKYVAADMATQQQILHPSIHPSTRQRFSCRWTRYVSFIERCLPFPQPLHYISCPCISKSHYCTNKSFYTGDSRCDNSAARCITGSNSSDPTPLALMELLLFPFHESQRSQIDEQCFSTCWKQCFKKRSYYLLSQKLAVCFFLRRIFFSCEIVKLEF